MNSLIWQLGIIIVSLSLGFALGLLWSHAVVFDHGYRKGRAAMAWEIEEASGMHGPVCTCATEPNKCMYHLSRTNPDGTWTKN
jgi:hypothetical protein